MAPKFYDRDGNKIALLYWGELNRRDYYIYVAHSTLRDAEDQDTVYDVSTIWTGMDTAMGENSVPKIFETVVRPVTDKGLGDALVQRRWATEAEAHQGHLDVALEYAADTFSGTPILEEVEPMWRKIP